MTSPPPSLLRQLARGAVVLLIDAATLLVLSEVLTRFVLDGPEAALAMAAVVGLLNSFVWPLVARFALPLSVLTLGGAALVLNGILVAVAAEIIPGASLVGWPEGIVVTIGLTILTALTSALLAIDEDEAWHRNVVRRALGRRDEVIESEIPGIAFLEIDGLAHEIVQRALRDGTMPNLARWIREGDHRLVRWETDWSSQTGACQAGLLHGSNEDMPAFRWWEKDTGRAIVTNHPRDAEEIERRRSNGRGLLHADGASRANILSGDAPHSMLTMSTAMRRRRPLGRDYAAYFAAPYAVIRTFVMALVEIARERRAAGRQRRRDVRPRIDRSRTYALAAAWATVVQLDLQVAAVIGDILSGRPVIYTTFLAYDEIAHHSGIECADTLAVLAKVDRQLGRIAAAAEHAPRPYRLVVLSDHGQSQGATFKQRYGQTLEELVREATGREVRAESGGEDEAMSFMGTGLTEVGRDDTAAGRAVRSATGRRTADGIVTLDPEAREALGSRDDEPPELSVMASGCLGLIDFPREPGRVTMERLEELYPRLLPALRGHPGIGFVLARSAEHGAVALGSNGVHYLDRGEVEGTDPLAPFGPTAADHVRRTDGFAHCPDVMVNSAYWEETEEVAAFEELVGSHGGMGGPQSFPFAAFPAELGWPSAPSAPVVGPEHVHRIFRGWLAGLGHDAYNASDSPGSSTSTSTPGASAST